MSTTLSTNKYSKKDGIQKVKEHLEAGRSITPLEALGNWGMFRLATAINVLRNRGMSIRTDLKEDPNGKQYAQYSLEAKKELKVGAKVRVLVDVEDMGYKAGEEGEVMQISTGIYGVSVKVPSRKIYCAFNPEELEVI